MKFIHAADLHIDTPFAGVNGFSSELQENLKKSTYTAAKKVFQTAIDKKVDFIILAGDIFDDTDRSLEAQSFLKDQFETMNKYGIKVYLVYGNHDYYRNDYSIIKFPNNVTVFGSDVTTASLEIDNMKVGITGFSYYQQHVSADMVSQYPSRGKFDYQIGILHAGVMDNNYAPFKVTDLLSKGYDYWALGHIHKREILNKIPYVIYPGDTQGRNQNDLGEKGFYLVTVKDRITTAQFIPSSVYIWRKEVIDAEDDDTLDSLISKISNILVNQNTMTTLTINNAQKLSDEVVKSIDRGEILHHFRNNKSAILYKIYPKYNKDNNLSEIDQKYWDDSKTEVFDLDGIKDMDSRLYNNEVIREHINQTDFLKNMKELVENTINKKYNGE
ncbi:metallophosphoesterase family protein [Companilactobacillus keshanensis]|uniref:Metallophosphoesterase n=1 Tax=Companilactobacillus keshanensis TaxID=2486003 RepID=A0ABW4BUJ8_9LACO|nr:DNA repair exonuclease [Companilactobacillus keshanensis]